MLTLHQALIHFRNALGYRHKETGVCVLHAEMAINAFLVGDLARFNQRCSYIQRNVTRADFLDRAKKVMTNPRSLQKERNSPGTSS